MIMQSTKIIMTIIKWSRVAIQKRCLNSGQIDVISREFFGLNCRHFTQGILEEPNMRWLYSQAILSLAKWLIKIISINCNHN